MHPELWVRPPPCSADSFSVSAPASSHVQSARDHGAGLERSSEKRAPV